MQTIIGRPLAGSGRVGWAWGAAVSPSRRRARPGEGPSRPDWSVHFIGPVGTPRRLRAASLREGAVRLELDRFDRREVVADGFGRLAAEWGVEVEGEPVRPMGVDQPGLEGEE
jgi:hypothetical protein